MGTTFMKDINSHISDPEIHNQNPVKGKIREVRQK